MKLHINKNASKRLYHIVGFDHCGEINFKMSVAELLSNNTDTDSELLYTLQELHTDKILDLKVGENVICKSSRDENEFNNIIVNRIR